MSFQFSTHIGSRSFANHDFKASTFSMIIVKKNYNTVYKLKVSFNSPTVIVCKFISIKAVCLFPLAGWIKRFTTWRHKVSCRNTIE